MDNNRFPNPHHTHHWAGLLFLGLYRFLSYLVPSFFAPTPVFSGCRRKTAIEHNHQVVESSVDPYPSNLQHLELVYLGKEDSGSHPAKIYWDSSKKPFTLVVKPPTSIIGQLPERKENSSDPSDLVSAKSETSSKLATTENSTTSYLKTKSLTSEPISTFSWSQATSMSFKKYSVEDTKTVLQSVSFQKIQKDTLSEGATSLIVEQSTLQENYFELSSEQYPSINLTKSERDVTSMPTITQMDGTSPEKNARSLTQLFTSDSMTSQKATLKPQENNELEKKRSINECAIPQESEKDSLELGSDINSTRENGFESQTTLEDSLSLHKGSTLTIERVISQEQSERDSLQPWSDWYIKLARSKSDRKDTTFRPTATPENDNQLTSTLVGPQATGMSIKKEKDVSELPVLEAAAFFEDAMSPSKLQKLEEKSENELPITSPKNSHIIAPATSWSEKDSIEPGSELYAPSESDQKEEDNQQASAMTGLQAASMSFEKEEEVFTITELPVSRVAAFIDNAMSPSTTQKEIIENELPFISPGSSLIVEHATSQSERESIKTGSELYFTSAPLESDQKGEDNQLASTMAGSQATSMPFEKEKEDSIISELPVSEVAAFSEVAMSPSKLQNEICLPVTSPKNSLIITVLSERDSKDSGSELYFTSAPSESDRKDEENQLASTMSGSHATGMSYEKEKDTSIGSKLPVFERAAFFEDAMMPSNVQKEKSENDLPVTSPKNSQRVTSQSERDSIDSGSELYLTSARSESDRKDEDNKLASTMTGSQAMSYEKEKDISIGSKLPFFEDAMPPSKLQKEITENELPVSSPKNSQHATSQSERDSIDSGSELYLTSARSESDRKDEDHKLASTMTGSQAMSFEKEKDISIGSKLSLFEDAMPPSKLLKEITENELPVSSPKNSQHATSQSERDSIDTGSELYLTSARLESDRQDTSSRPTVALEDDNRVSQLASTMAGSHATSMSFEKENDISIASELPVSEAAASSEDAMSPKTRNLRSKLLKTEQKAVSEPRVTSPRNNLTIEHAKSLAINLQNKTESGSKLHPTPTKSGKYAKKSSLKKKFKSSSSAVIPIICETNTFESGSKLCLTPTKSANKTSLKKKLKALSSAVIRPITHQTNTYESGSKLYPTPTKSGKDAKKRSLKKKLKSLSSAVIRPITRQTNSLESGSKLYPTPTKSGKDAKKRSLKKKLKSLSSAVIPIKSETNTSSSISSSSSIKNATAHRHSRKYSNEPFPSLTETGRSDNVTSLSINTQKKGTSLEQDSLDSSKSSSKTTASKIISLESSKEKNKRPETSPENSFSTISQGKVSQSVRYPTKSLSELFSTSTHKEDSTFAPAITLEENTPTSQLISSPTWSQPTSISSKKEKGIFSSQTFEEKKLKVSELTTSSEDAMWYPRRSKSVSFQKIPKEKDFLKRTKSLSIRHSTSQEESSGFSQSSSEKFLSSESNSSETSHEKGAYSSSSPDQSISQGKTLTEGEFTEKTSAHSELGNLPSSYSPDYSISQGKPSTKGEPTELSLEKNSAQSETLPSSSSPDYSISQERTSTEGESTKLSLKKKSAHSEPGTLPSSSYPDHSISLGKTSTEGESTKSSLKKKSAHSEPGTLPSSSYPDYSISLGKSSTEGESTDQLSPEIIISQAEPEAAIVGDAKSLKKRNVKKKLKSKSVSFQEIPKMCEEEKFSRHAKSQHAISHRDSANRLTIPTISEHTMSHKNKLQHGGGGVELPETSSTSKGSVTHLGKVSAS